MADGKCPFAARCWMGGGSYACVKTPPFCNEPLIPKDCESVEPERESPDVPIGEPPITECPSIDNGGDIAATSEPIQGELF